MKRVTRRRSVCGKVVQVVLFHFALFGSVTLTAILIVLPPRVGAAVLASIAFVMTWLCKHGIWISKCACQGCPDTLCSAKLHRVALIFSMRLRTVNA